MTHSHPHGAAGQARPRQPSPAACQAELQAIAADHPGVSSAAQRRRILSALAIGPLTTVEARRWLDVMNISQRITELRQAGTRIDTARSVELTEPGEPHRVARYALLTQSVEVQP